MRSARLLRSRPTFSPRHSSSTAAGGMPVTASMRAAAARRAGQSSSLLVLVSPRTRLANEGGARCRSLATHRNDCTCPAACPSPPSKDAVCTERPKNAGQRISILCSGWPRCHGAEPTVAGTVAGSSTDDLRGSKEEGQYSDESRKKAGSSSEAPPRSFVISPVQIVKSVRCLQYDEKRVRRALRPFGPAPEINYYTLAILVRRARRAAGSQSGA